MKPKLMPMALIAVHTFLGNLCLMPMAFALESMPMDENTLEMEEVTEMVMTPANAMSPLHCDSCVTLSRPRHHVPDMGGNNMPCNDGHCLSDNTPSTASVIQSPLKNSAKTAIIPTYVSYIESQFDIPSSGWRDDYPVRNAIMRTIVLRE